MCSANSGQISPCTCYTGIRNVQWRVFARVPGMCSYCEWIYLCMLQCGYPRTGAGPSTFNGVCNLLKLASSQLEGSGADPAIYLLRRSGTDDSSRDPWPHDHPGYGDCGYRRPVPFGRSGEERPSRPDCGLGWAPENRENGAANHPRQTSQYSPW